MVTSSISRPAGSVLRCSILEKLIGVGYACVHRGECVRVCMSVFDCTVFRKKKKKTLQEMYLISSTMLQEKMEIVDRRLFVRSTMLQDGLNDLAMCYTKKDILDNIDLVVVLNDFASRNARK